MPHKRMYAFLDALPDKPGVYVLTHVDTSDKYIGSSVNIRARACSHLSKLRNRNHPNRLLRKLAESSGVKFTIDVLELTAEEHRVIAESRWIKQLSPSMNLQGFRNRRLPRRIVPKRSVYLNLKPSTMAAMRRVSQSSSIRPTFSQMIEAAVADWLPQAERALHNWRASKPVDLELHAPAPKRRHSPRPK